jgi:Tfp pilus assembly protein PilF
MILNSRHIFPHPGRSVFSYSVTLAILLFSFSICFAQGTMVNLTGMSGNEQIVGRIFFPAGDHTAARPLIKLQSLSSPEITGVADRDGNFRFTNLKPDQYTIIVDAGEAYEPASDTVIIGNSGPVPAQGSPSQYAVPLVYQVHLYLRPRRTDSNQNAAINVALAQVPATARELYQQAVESARAGNHAKAIEQLQSAVAQAPKFTLAYNELGVQFLRAGQLDKAVAAFKEALAISPADFTLRLNYGIALLNQKKFADAETELRAAVEKNSASAVAHYYLGLALMKEEKFDRAQAEFETAIKNGGDKLAPAHRYLGGVYWHNHDYQHAANELEKYLELEPKAPDANKIRETIKEFRQKS